MPICIPGHLPARQVLESENIFVMPEERAQHQDIRPLDIVILNLMPKKIETETQLLRLLGNTSLQVNVDLLQISSHTSKNTSPEHLLNFYQTFDQIKHRSFDGMIITGAPLENLPFEEVDYWPELCEIMDWSMHHVYSTLHICWGAQAGLYHHYGIDKRPLPAKMFGVFPHSLCVLHHPLLRGFDEVFYAPHSRHTTVNVADVALCEPLMVLSISEEAGLYIAASKNGRQFFVTGHSEYDRDTLAGEYFRDKDKGLPIELPKHYFPGDDPQHSPVYNWRGHAHLLYANWLNYYVYQETPYDLTRLDEVISY